MIIGIPKEIKDNEFRVSLTPGNVRELVGRGHRVLVEHDAGKEVGFSDDHYRKSGAEIESEVEEIFSNAEMIVKVKEPQPHECRLLKRDQILFAFLHLAPNPKLAEWLLASNCIAIAYETVTDDFGGLPLLTPMSEIAGRFSIQAGAHCLEKEVGGSGILLEGVPGVSPAKIVILGGGVVGTEALRIALGMGADVIVLDKSLKRLRELENIFEAKIKTCYSSAEKIEEHLVTADLVIGAVLVPGEMAPKLVTRSMLRQMKPGSVIVDVSIDQGGCFETSLPTTHSHPTYIEEGIIHYCVTNMPGAVPLTSSLALSNATLPFVSTLADKGYKVACLENVHLKHGLNICAGHVTHPGVAKALKKPYTPPEELF